MPNRALSTLDYIAIAKARLRGQSQEQVAEMSGVSVSLIRKIEQSNQQYQQIKKDLLASVVAETGRHMVQPQRTSKGDIMNSHKLVTLEHMLQGCQQRIRLIGDELIFGLNTQEFKSTRNLQCAIVHLSRIVDQAERLKENVLEMFEREGHQMTEGLNPVGPRTLIFRDERYECENYKECWFKYCELVSEHCGEQFDVVFSYEDLRWHFTKKPKNSGGREFRLIKGTDIYVDCNLTFDTIKSNMHTIYNYALGYKGIIE